jgi:hypothetical protein
MARMKKNILVAAYTEKKKEEDRQKALRDKHGVTDEKIKIVEKSPVGTVYKATVDMFIRIIKAILWVVIFALATIGLICLVYPETRAGALALLDSLIEQIKAFT